MGIVDSGQEPHTPSRISPCPCLSSLELDLAVLLTIDFRISILLKEIGLWFLATSQIEPQTGKTSGAVRS